MTCDSIRRLLNAYHDGEIGDVERILEIENHLETCADCAQDLRALRGLSGAVREKATYFQAPDSLRRRINVATQPTVPWWQRATLPTVSFAALAAAVALVTFRPGSNGLETKLIEDHIRSLQADHLFDVASSNRHTVKPWFQGRLDFSPFVPDLSSKGFPLLGGRLEYLDHRPAAALVYGRGKHIINVFVFPSVRSSGPGGHGGFHIVTWKLGDLDYWAVSDVGSGDLDQFASEFKTEAAK